MRSFSMIGACFTLGIIASDISADKRIDKGMINSILTDYLCNLYYYSPLSEDEMYNILTDRVMHLFETQPESRLLLTEKNLELIYDVIKSSDGIESDSMRPCFEDEMYATCLKTNIVIAILAHQNKLAITTDALENSKESTGNKRISRFGNHKRDVDAGVTSNTLGLEKEKYQSTLLDKMIRNESIQTEDVESPTKDLKQVDEMSPELIDEDISSQTHISSTLVDSNTDQDNGKNYLKLSNLSAVNTNENKSQAFSIPQTSSPNNEERAFNGTILNNELEVTGISYPKAPPLNKQYNQMSKNTEEQAKPVIDIMKNITSNTSRLTEMQSSTFSDLQDTKEYNLVSDINLLGNRTGLKTTSNGTTDAVSLITAVEKQVIDKLNTNKENASDSLTENIEEQTTVELVYSIEPETISNYAKDLTEEEENGFKKINNALFSGFCTESSPDEQLETLDRTNRFIFGTSMLLIILGFVGAIIGIF